jgi:hypothetical protein
LPLAIDSTQAAWAMAMGHLVPNQAPMSLQPIHESELFYEGQQHDTGLVYEAQQQYTSNGAHKPMAPDRRATAQWSDEMRPASHNLYSPEPNAYGQTSNYDLAAHAHAGVPYDNMTTEEEVLAMYVDENGNEVYHNEHADYNVDEYGNEIFHDEDTAVDEHDNMLTLDDYLPHNEVDDVELDQDQDTQPWAQSQPLAGPEKISYADVIVLSSQQVVLEACISVLFLF